MINKLFKDGKIDIHGGGQDLKIPHHEMKLLNLKLIVVMTIVLLAIGFIMDLS